MAHMMADALKKINLTKTTVGLGEVNLDMTLLPNGFIRKAFPDTPPAHKYHDFGDMTQCVYEGWESGLPDGVSRKVRCPQPALTDGSNGFVCATHLKAKRSNLPPGSIYKLSEKERAHTELIDFIVGAEKRAIGRALIQSRVNFIRTSCKGNGMTVVVPHVDSVF